MSVLPSYSTHDPRGWCGDPSRGAALGRHLYEGESSFDGKFTLRRVYLDSGGYDPNGTYFGHGTPIYWYANHDGPEPIDRTLRAHSRAEAKIHVLRLYPKARFYR